MHNKNNQKIVFIEKYNNKKYNYNNIDGNNDANNIQQKQQHSSRSSFVTGNNRKILPS